MKTRVWILAALFLACGIACTEGQDGASGEKRVIRSDHLIGSWYVSDGDLLRTTLKGYFDNVKDEKLDKVCALILPHAGHRYSGQTAAHGAAQVLDGKFTRVVVIGPSHRYSMENMASIPFATHYETPLGEAPLDTKFLQALRRYPCFQNTPGVHTVEHSVQIEVPFLQYALKGVPIVPIVVGDLDEEAARAMARILLGLIDERTLLVVSSDFTHYGRRFAYVPFEKDIRENLEKLDMDAFETLRKKDPAAFRRFLADTEDTICGRNAIHVLWEMLPKDASVKLLNYDTSGRLVSDWSNSVSYLSIAVTGTWTPAQEREEAPATGEIGNKEKELLLKLARKSIEFRLEKDQPPTAAELGIEPVGAMKWPRAAFVTLHKEGRLRGCIGSIYPVRPLYREVMSRAQDAALNDRRFRPVTKEEAKDLHIEISALTPPRAVRSRREIEIGKHGIILEKDGGRAVFLPQVAPEQGWDLETTLTHLSEKAGLPGDAWKEGASFMVFEADVFAEPEK